MVALVRRQGYACSGGEGAERERRDLRHDGVAKGLQPSASAFGCFTSAGRLPWVLRFAAACGPSVAVQPTGKPISTSTHSGVIAFPACAESDPANPFALAPPLQSCAVGVAHLTTSAEILGVLRRISEGDGLCPASDVVGVGQCESFTAVASPSPDVADAPSRLCIPHTVGVGQAENALSSVGGAHVGCSKHVPLCIVPERGQAPENTSPCAPVVESKEPCDVLHEDEAGSYHANDPSKLRPQPAVITHPFTLARDARRLTGETPADQVHRGELGAHRAHVVEARRIRPVPRKHAAAPRVALDLPHDAATRCGLSTKLQTADAREQRPYQHLAALRAATNSALASSIRRLRLMQSASAAQ